MTKSIVNNRTDALKTDIDLFFTITNCRIARSRSLTFRMNYSGAPAARRAAKRSPILIMNEKEKEILMVILASGIARGRVRTTTTTTTTTAELPNMAAILQKRDIQPYLAYGWRAGNLN